MSIWILAFALCAVFGLIGFFSGGIRASAMLLGVFVANLFTGAIAPKLTSLMPKIGIKHPIWIQFAPYIIVFALIALVIYGLSFGLHWKVTQIYKYRRDDFSRQKWEKMIKQVGLSVGLVIALFLFVTIARVAYVGGYLTAQVADEGSAANNPGWIKFLTALRSDMQSTGMDKSIAALDKTSPYFYDVADVVGLIYHNPSLQSRLANYPEFFAIGQRPEFQEIAADKAFNEMIFGKQPFGTIINDPNTQRLLANQDLLAEFHKIDVQDLLAYLRTGHSKYDEEKILGRWILDKPSILTSVRKAKPDLKGNELVALKRGIDMLPEITLINMPEGKCLVKAEGGAPAAAAPPGGAPPPPNAPPPPDPSVERYRQFTQQRGPGGRGQRGGPGGPRPAAAPQRAVGPVEAPPVLQIAGEGEWKQGATGQYQLTLNDAGGRPQTLTGTVLDDELTVTKDGRQLVFFKAE
jgi:hypothetical protein